MAEREAAVRAGRLDRLTCTAAGVRVEVDRAARFLSWTWLRDHARDPGSFHEGAQQRLVPLTVSITAGAGVATIEENDELVVTWPDGPIARYPADLLASLGPPSSVGEVGLEPLPWRGPELASRLERIGNDEFVGSADGLGRGLRGLARDGVVVVDDVPTDIAATQAVLERIGYVRSTIFGGMWSYRSDGGYDDTASTSLEITPHTDGTYSNDAPGLLALHCHRYEATGGENVVVDGLTVAAELESTDPAAADVLRTVDVPAQYIGDGVHLVARRPILRHDGGRLVQVSYNHHDRAPFLLPEPEMSAVYGALAAFDAVVARPEHRFELALRPGEMLLLDNWRILHGRRAFEGERAMAGGYLNREDVESALRADQRRRRARETG